MKTLAFFGFIVGFILSLVFLAATGCGGSDRGIIGTGVDCIAETLVPGDPDADDCLYYLDQDLFSYSICVFELTKKCFSDQSYTIADGGSDPGGQMGIKKECEDSAKSCMLIASVCKNQTECHDLIEDCWNIPDCWK